MWLKDDYDLMVANHVKMANRALLKKYSAESHPDGVAYGEPYFDSFGGENDTSVWAKALEFHIQEAKYWASVNTFQDRVGSSATVSETG